MDESDNLLTQHVTIVIPAYNTSRYLPECLESIALQQYPDFDIVVVNDGSMDNTAEVVEQFMTVVPGLSLTNQKHAGVTFATTTGIEHARGPLITIVDSDDRLLPNALTIGTEPFNNDPDVGFVWSQFLLASGGCGWSHPLPSNARNLYQAMMYQNWWKAAHHKFFKKSVLSVVPALNCEIDRASDYQLVLLLALSGCKCVHVPELTYWYRNQRNGSLTSQGRDRQLQATQQIRQWLQTKITELNLVEPW